MIADLTCIVNEKANGMAALALVVAMIDLLNSSGKLSDDEVSDICRNAQALLPEADTAADDARKVLSGISLTRSIEAPSS
jgi:exoribonuclease II